MNVLQIELSYCKFVLYSIVLNKNAFFHYKNEFILERNQVKRVLTTVQAYYKRSQGDSLTSHDRIQHPFFWTRN